MTEAGGGLFAGLSMAPSVPTPSVDKKKPPPPPPPPPAAPKQDPAELPAASSLRQTSTSDSSTTAAEPPKSVSSEPPVEVAPPPPPQVAPQPQATLENAPATDKLLGLLGRASSAPAPATTTTTTTTTPRPTTNSRSSSSGEAKKQGSVDPEPTGGKKLFVESEGTKDSPDKKKEAEQDSKPAATEPKKERPKMDAETLAAFSEDSTTTPVNNKATRDAKGGEKPAASAAPSLRGVGIVHPDTPIPNSDVALRLLVKFADKTRPWVSATHGGTQRRPIMSYIFGMPSEYDRRFDAYRELVNAILDEEQKFKGKEEQEQVRMVIARFCHLISTWGHASAHMAEAERNSQYQAFCDILAVGLDTATALVTHGCLDGVMIGIGPNHDEYHKAVDFLAQSVFASDLSQDRNELSAMKFLLSTGCRVGVNGEAMLRGSHLLQTVRVLYHVYLSTFSNANKTTARASLQQLVTSVFIRMISTTHALGTNASSPPPSQELRTPQKGGSVSGGNDDGFPSQDHRDAVLLLRSLCKLSMRTPPGGKLHSHVGLQASGSNSMWDSAKDAASGGGAPTTPRRGGGGATKEKALSDPNDSIQLVSTQAIHPALESKILALQLMLYVLQNTDMKGAFLQKCGPQFHYAIRNYLCASLLKNCTSDNVQVVNLSLRVFVPIIKNFRSILKTEIEAFVTNVFFVILDSPNSPIEHKCLVVTLFDEICSDPTTLAEIFLNYDCDLSAVDLFHRIVNTLSKVARTTEVKDESASSYGLDLTGSAAARMERIRRSHRELRLDAMRALRQVLASLHASITEPMIPLDATSTASNTEQPESAAMSNGTATPTSTNNKNKKNQIIGEDGKVSEANPQSDEAETKSLVEIYGSKKKRREEEAEAVLRFNQKPSAGIAYAAKCGHLDGTDPVDVARYLLQNKDTLEKTMIGEYLGREPEYQEGFSLRVLQAYVDLMDFVGLSFDDAIRFYLSGFRLPGEAQKVRKRLVVCIKDLRWTFPHMFGLYVALD
eukprot:scaffold9704_cov113-Cylindrotheca_fusiformis.AAC.4